MRTVARYDFTFAPSRSISSSPTRAHRIPRTVFAASATAFEAAFAKLCGEVPTMSMIFWTIRFTHRAMATRSLVRFASGFRPGLAGLDLSRVRELLQDRREPGSLLPHRLDVLLEERPPFRAAASPCVAYNRAADCSASNRPLFRASIKRRPFAAASFTFEIRSTYSTIAGIRRRSTVASSLHWIWRVRRSSSRTALSHDQAASSALRIRRESPKTWVRFRSEYAGSSRRP